MGSLGKISHRSGVAADEVVEEELAVPEGGGRLKEIDDVGVDVNWPLDRDGDGFALESGGPLKSLGCTLYDCMVSLDDGEED